MRFAPFVLLAGACTTPPRARPVAPPAPEPSLTGNWTWSHRTIHPVTGDVHVQEETWHLDRDGDLIRGHYERSVTAISGDGRPFRCNEELSFTRRTRYQVRGSLRGRHLRVEETDYTADAGDCDDGQRSLDHYEGDFQDDSIVLRWGTGEQILRRAEQVPPPSAIDLAGEWTWQHRTVGADGDLRVEEERWSLAQRDGEIVGRYQSMVTVTAGGDLPFHCNQAAEYTMRAEFDVVGRVDAGRVMLRETAVRVQEGPCDRGERRLASYRGSLAEGALVLDWGGGRQTLHRRPTPLSAHTR